MGFQSMSQQAKKYQSMHFYLKTQQQKTSI